MLGGDQRNLVPSFLVYVKSMPICTVCGRGKHPDEFPGKKPGRCKEKKPYCRKCNTKRISKKYRKKKSTKAKDAARHKEKWANDPEFREKSKARNRASSKARTAKREALRAELKQMKEDRRKEGLFLEKECYVCHEDKREYLFATYKRKGETRYLNKCLDCEAEYRQEKDRRYIERNREKRNQRARDRLRERYHSDPEYRARRLKRAKKDYQEDPETGRLIAKIAYNKSRLKKLEEKEAATGANLREKKKVYEERLKALETP